MAKQTYYDWRSASGKRGRSTASGILKLLRGGTTFTHVGRPKRASAGERVAAAARAEVGTLEVPRDSNSGPRVKLYQASTTLPGTGWAWCAAFRRFVRDVAGVDTKGYRGGYCPHLEFWARQAGKWSSKPTLGADALMDWHGDGVADHVGVVVQVSPLVLVEGNAQPGPGGNQSNGGGVYERRDRTPNQIRGFVRI